MGITPIEMDKREIIDQIREENQEFSDIFDEISLLVEDAYEWCYDTIIEGYERRFGRFESET